MIIPAHNSSAYIRTGLDSIRNQTFKDYELIIVCDSCTDSTLKIAKEYTDNVYITDFHQDGQARNVGLDHATGEWILFMDDDDHFLHEFVFQQIADMAGKHGEDVLAFSFIWKGVGYAQNRKDHMWIGTWSKCWRREFVGNARFSDADYNSDRAFHYGVMDKNPVIHYYDMPMYYWNYMRKGSQSYLRHQRGEPL